MDLPLETSCLLESLAGWGKEPLRGPMLSWPCFTKLQFPPQRFGLENCCHLQLVRRLWVYLAWKTSVEGEGLEGSLGALLDHLLPQVVPLEVRGGSPQDGDPSDCVGNRQD